MRSLLDLRGRLKLPCIERFSQQVVGAWDGQSNMVPGVFFSAKNPLKSIDTGNVSTLQRIKGGSNNNNNKKQQQQQQATTGSVE